LLLINADSQSREYFEIEFAKRSEAQQSNGLIQHRPPAQNTHNEFSGKVPVKRGKAIQNWRMKKLYRIGRFPLHTHQDVECGQPCWRNGHAWLTKPLARGGTISVDEFPRRDDFLSFRLDLQQLQHSAAATADKELFIADAHLSGIEI
jgi:hypothetical protein